MILHNNWKIFFELKKKNGFVFLVLVNLFSRIFGYEEVIVLAENIWIWNIRVERQSRRDLDSDAGLCRGGSGGRCCCCRRWRWYEIVRSDFHLCLSEGIIASPQLPDDSTEVIVLCRISVVLAVQVSLKTTLKYCTRIESKLSIDY